MAKIKNAGRQDVICVLENPTPGANLIYIEGEGYNLTTLAPIFNADAYMRFGYPASNYEGFNWSFQKGLNGSGEQARLGSDSWSLALTKECAGCIQDTYGDTNNPVTNVSLLHMLSLDSNVIAAPVQRLTSNNNFLNIWTASTSQHNFSSQKVWYNVPGPSHLWPVTNQVENYQFSNGFSHPKLVTVREGNTDWVSCLHMNHTQSGEGQGRGALGRNSFSNWSTSNQTRGTNERQYYTIQYIGQSGQNGRPIYLYNYMLNDFTQTITRHNVNDNNFTDLYNFTTTPSAGGTSAGGSRLGTSIALNASRMASHTFTDPTVANGVCFFVPYLDTNLNYHPMVIHWNRSNDVFTRSTNTSITGANSSTMWTSARAGQDGASLSATVYWNETFTNGGNRYLTLMHLCGYYLVHDTAPSARVFLTYLVDPTNPRNLTYHSSVTIPSTPRQAVFLNDARTLLGVITANILYIYSWNNTNGWVLTSTINEQIFNLGRDSTDRIWATSAIGGSIGEGRFQGSQTGLQYHGDIHVITPSIPVRITITTANSTYDYVGTTISTTANVSAYNVTNQRIATQVNLNIEGSTITFTGGANTTTINTSTTGETSVPINIVGSGLSDIVANIVI
jgi:hypothetical protein